MWFLLIFVRCSLSLFLSWNSAYVWCVYVIFGHFFFEFVKIRLENQRIHRFSNQRLLNSSQFAVFNRKLFDIWFGCSEIKNFEHFDIKLTLIHLLSQWNELILWMNFKVAAEWVSKYVISGMHPISSLCYLLFLLKSAFSIEYILIIGMVLWYQAKTRYFCIQVHTKNSYIIPKAHARTTLWAMIKLCNPSAEQKYPEQEQATTK